MDTWIASFEFLELRGKGWKGEQNKLCFDFLRSLLGTQSRARSSSGKWAPRRPTTVRLRPHTVTSNEGNSGQDPPSRRRRPRSARGLAPPPPGPDDPRRRWRRGHCLRATHMCGFLLKALVMSFTTRCTSTATSSLVSAMLAAAAAARARLRESSPQPAGVPRGARACAPVWPPSRLRPCASAPPPPPPPPLSTSGSTCWRPGVVPAETEPAWLDLGFLPLSLTGYSLTGYL